ncbi:MAG: hypothetical protein A2140_05690 [Candidatus Muproteobacteria bacterium RBG_16_62_13]|uniref:Type II secretion system protein n=1 Tax=Candidatus Muproteobacteria bacterium RBG_16_62_13 TaxID=1817756 RepID=A0A1F6T7L5_9PROT|nr:MAG: hypothetical protein A2140_05690 [Candidatus Muproteobacteria bacterium RBG_16_62_13]
MTLVELIISIAIIGIAVAGVLGVMNATTMRSADPMVREQAQLIAEAYMEEISLKAFVDPSANTICPAVPAARTDYNNVCDYRGLTDTGARDQFGTAIPALADYTVNVTVSPSPADPTAAVDLNGVANDYVNNWIRVLRVDVTVTGPNGTSTVLTGYRTDYDCVIGTGVNCSPLI